MAFTAHSARAADGPLLVVVEAPPALDADAAEIRRAIGAELGARTIAPMKTSVDASDRALIVALDRDRIAMSLRTGDGVPVARVIAAPPDRTARLRAIAWLAGNLARDQVSPIVAESPIEMPSLAPLPPAPVAPIATEPPPEAVVAPSPVTVPPPGDSTAATISSRYDKPSGLPRWSLVATDGLTTKLLPPCWSHDSPTCLPFASEGTAWRIEVQRRSGANGLFTGAALSGTAGDYAPQLLGASAFAGFTRRLGRWSFEFAGGAGLELAEVPVTTVTLMQSITADIVTAVTTNNATRPALCADGSIGVAHPISDSLDIVVRLGAHLTTVAYDNWFLSGTLGLRYNLQ
jgi:hypothetical protein